VVAIPLAAALIAGLHTASLIGQRWSADQMQLLRSRFDRAMELAFGEATAAPARELPVSESVTDTGNG
jgi:hypothetical protein